MHYPEPISKLIDSFMKLPESDRKQRFDWHFRIRYERR